MAFEQREYQTVVLGALLHDVGKFLQRGEFGSLNVGGQHPEVSARFVEAFAGVFGPHADPALLKTLVQRHHESERNFPRHLLVQGLEDPHQRALAQMVSLADNLSSAERGQRTEQWQDFKTTPLYSVFGRVALPGAAGGTRPAAHRPVPLAGPEALEPAFPDPERTALERGEMNRLLKAFGEAWQGLAGSQTAQFEAFQRSLLAVLERYAWAVPANTQEERPDASLYDHLRSTAAIAACLYCYHAGRGSLEQGSIRAGADEERFLLACGDLSGIQRYIFDIASVGAGGVARRLRARSLYVQLLGDWVAHRLLRRRGLPGTNLLMHAGGRFYALMPNDEASHEAVAEVRRETDGWLLEHLHGELGLNLAAVPFDDAGFTGRHSGEGGFGELLRRLGEELAGRKLRGLESVLQGDGGWREGAFLRPADFRGEAPCRVCGKFPRAGEDSWGERRPEGRAGGGVERQDPEACGHCRADVEAGRRLPKASYVVFFEGEGASISLPGGSAELLEDQPRDGSRELVLAINHERAAPGAVPRFLGQHVPLYRDLGATTAEEARQLAEEPDEEAGPEAVATFGALARCATGRPLLGFLKADVDRLGEVMTQGLRRDGGEDERTYDTVSRLATLSRMLETFFAGWVEGLLRTEFKECYAIFSGGDDLFVAGPWDRALELAGRVRADFQRYTCNPGLTLSAAVVIAGQRYPVARAAAAAEHELGRAKRCGRDRISVLGEVLTWEEWGAGDQHWRRLQGLATAEKAPAALLYRLRRFGEMWSQYKAGQVSALRFHPLLAYAVARTIDPRSMPRSHSYAEELLRWPPGEETKELLGSLALAARLAILSRGGDVS